MACRSVVLNLASAIAVTAILGGCQTYNGLRRDLGVDPVDPQRATAGAPQMASAAPTLASSSMPLRAGDVSQASWAAQRAASYTSQSNTTPVDYTPSVKKVEEEAKPAEDQPASSQPANVKPAVLKPSGQPIPIKPGAAMPHPSSASASVAASSASPKSTPALAASPATPSASAMPAGYKPSVAAPAVPVAKATAAAADKPVSASAGPWRAHLASHRTEGAAINEWQELLKRDPNLYGQFDPRIEWVDLKDRGSFARLMIGGWADRKEADAACARIRGPQRYCAAVKE
jgi:hypothetical protein